MARARKYDLDFQPASYWGPHTASKRILANIKGAERKKWAREALKGGRVAEAEKWVLQEKLTEADRTAVGRVHPRFMGGEYLPDSKRGEVEIARVTLQSSTQDVYSIRARLVAGRIKYRVADEYDTEWKASPLSSLQPLSMKRLISLMDCAKCDGYDGARWKTGVVWGPLTMNLESCEEIGEDPMELLGFIEVTSEFYPQLQRYYASKIEDFLRECS